MGTQNRIVVIVSMLPHKILLLVNTSKANALP
jgi:hypothetical protein